MNIEPKQATGPGQLAACGARDFQSSFFGIQNVHRVFGYLLSMDSVYIYIYIHVDICIIYVYMYVYMFLQ